MLTDHDHALQVEECRRDWGFWLDPGPGGWWLFVPAGQDPADNAPLTWARVATPEELALWEKGALAKLAKLVARDVPGGLPKTPAKRPWWKRLLGRR